MVDSRTNEEREADSKIKMTLTVSKPLQDDELVTDINQLTDWVDKFEELMPKTADETMSYPQFCAVRQFVSNLLEEKGRGVATTIRDDLIGKLDLLPSRGDDNDYSEDYERIRKADAVESITSYFKDRFNV